MGRVLAFLAIALGVVTFVVLCMIKGVGAGIGGIETPWFGWFLWVIVPFAADFVWAWWAFNGFMPRTRPFLVSAIVLGLAAIYVDVVWLIVVLPISAACIWMWRKALRLIDEGQQSGKSEQS